MVLTNDRTGVRIQGMDIKDLRQKLGLTQEKLAQRLGVSSYTVRRWESGKVKPSPLAQKAIGDLLRGGGNNESYPEG